MKKEFLEDYDAKENKALEKFEKRAIQEGIEKVGRFPDNSRFKIINEPIVHYDRSCVVLDNDKVWTQIPFAGTLMISLFPVSKENMLPVNGIDPNDIPKLMDLAKETGKVQFGLSSSPLAYEKLDHLEPIFTEFNPPRFGKIPIDIIDPKTHEKGLDEFDTLASISFYEKLQKYVDEMGEGTQFFEQLRNNRGGMFADLRLLKMDDIADEIVNYIIDDPVKANDMLGTYMIATTPLFDALHAYNNVSLTKMRKFNVPSYGNTPIRYPVEIGKFLMKKLTFLPPTYDACIDVIGHYKQNDLYKILESLDKGVKNRSEDSIIKNSTELNTIMDNVWKDAKKLRIQKEGIQNGISVVLGFIGEMATSTLGGFGGLLAGLGFNVADRMLELSDKSLSQKITNMLNRNYLVNIYDFQRKSSLPS